MDTDLARKIAGGAEMKTIVLSRPLHLARE
jgi:hypothetical protein